MAYTAENIANIKRAGKVESYLAHDKKLIETLENAQIKYDVQGSESVSYAHLYGHFGIDTETTAPYQAFASLSSGPWQKSWAVESFDGDQKRALAYAKKALENQLKEQARQVLTDAKSRVAALEAAI